MPVTSPEGRDWQEELHSRLAAVNDPESVVRTLHAELDTASDPERRLLLLDMLCLESLKTRSSETGNYAQRMLKLARAENLPYWSAIANLRLGLYADSRWKRGSAERYLNKAWKLIEDLPDCPADQSYILRTLGEVQRARTGRVELDSVVKAVSLSRESGHSVDLGFALCKAAEAHLDAGSLETGLDMALEALQIAGESNSMSLLAGVSLVVGNICVRVESWDRAESMMAKSLDGYVKLGDRQKCADAMRLLGIVCCNSGQYEKAHAMLTNSLELYSEFGNRDGASMTHAAMGQLFTAQRNFVEAGRYIELATELCADTENTIVRARVQRVRGGFHAEQEEWAVALPALEESLRCLRLGRRHESEGEIHKALGEAYNALGRYAESIEHYRLHVQSEQPDVRRRVRRRLHSRELQDSFSSPDAETNHRDITRLQGEVAEQSSELLKASLHFGRMSTLLMRLRDRLAGGGNGTGDVAGLVREIVGEIDSRGDAGDALGALEQGLQSMDREFTQLLTSTYPSLTSSEVKLCSLLYMGLANREIAELLHLSPRSVDTYRGRIRRKLKLSSDESLEGFLNSITNLTRD